jgi:hypothetical protein
VELARREFSQMLGKLVAPPGAPPVRPIGLVACDDSNDAERAARHLLQIDAPAVIGFRSSREAIDLANSFFVRGGVFTAVALNMSPFITTIPHSPGQPRLVWRTTYSSQVTALAVAALVADRLEPEMRKNHAVSSAPLRVALLRPENPTGMGFADALFPVLRFNGKKAVDNGDDYRSFVIHEDRLGDVAAARADAEEIARYAPHVIVYVSSPTPLTPLLEGIEAAWPRSSRHRPDYVTITIFGEPELRFIGSNADRRRRSFGITPVASTLANARFVNRYNEVFSGGRVTRTSSPNSSYDAFYLIAYAVHALGDQAVTGEAIARAVSRLRGPGKTIDVGAAGIFEGVSALRAGEAIDLNGATSRLDFDLATGEAPVDQAILCPKIDEGGRAVDSLESGLVFDGASRKLTGTLACP